MKRTRCFTFLISLICLSPMGPSLFAQEDGGEDISQYLDDGGIDHAKNLTFSVNAGVGFRFTPELNSAGENRLMLVNTILPYNARFGFVF